MPPHNTPRSPVRLLAPIALVAFAFALIVVVAGSSVTGNDGNDRTEGATGDQAPSAQTTEREPSPPKRQKRSYTVKLGDSLGAISEETGVEVETIQLLNPELDPQSLTVGQKIKLRE
jgi:LysM repeat protein